MVSIKDIAKAANVSITTVSRVITGNGYVKDSTRKNVEKAIKSLNYHPNAIARSMVKKQSKIVGLVVPYYRAPFFAALMESIDTRAQELGYNIMLCHTNEDIDKEKEYISLLVERRVDGIILLPVSREWAYLKAINKVMPLVLVSRRSADRSISCVRADDVNLSYQVVRYLLESGYRNIYVIKGFSFIMNSTDRMEGAERAFREYGIEPSEVITEEGYLSFNSGYECTLRLLNRNEKPEAIYALNHMMSLGAIKAINETGYRVPEDIAVAAYAGSEESEYEDFIQPKVTANRYPSYEIGDAAMKLLDELIALRAEKSAEEISPRDVVFGSNLIVQNSTRKI